MTVAIISGQFTDSSELTQSQPTIILPDMAKPLKQFSDQLREVVGECGIPPAEIARQTGIDKSTLSRFLSGERGLPMATLDMLAEFLRLEIRLIGPKRNLG
jgi:transcriptional regulator with XRE-family HTH domain